MRDILAAGEGKIPVNVWLKSFRTKTKSFCYQAYFSPEGGELCFKNSKDIAFLMRQYT